MTADVGIGGKLRVGAGVLVTAAAGSGAACGGIADMRSAPSGTFTVETPSLGAQTFEGDDVSVECLGRSWWGGGEPADPIDTLHVSLETGPDFEDTRVFFEVSPYERDGRIALRGSCDPGFCCAPGPCGTITVIGRDLAATAGGDPCWVVLAYANGWVRGDLDCSFAPHVSREPGTRVRGSFRCPIEE